MFSPDSFEAYINGCNILWNAFMQLIGLIAYQTPEDFSSSAWEYVVGDVMNWTLTIGSGLFVNFFLINMLRQTTDLKQGITLERMIEMGIGMILGNYAMIYGVELMSILFEIAGVASGAAIDNSGLQFAQSDWDIGAQLLSFFILLVYFVVVLVCGVSMVFVVYRRYLQLYAIVGLGPLAWSTITGGRGISSTAVSWFKSFLTKCFEIVVIALFITIASKMCGGINFGQASGGVASLFDGAVELFQNMLTMIILAGSVASSEVFLRKTFGL